jgi:hypothetical protein
MYNIIDFCIEMIRFFGKSSSSSTFESVFGITPVVHEMGFHKFIEQHHKNDKTVFWPDLASVRVGFQVGLFVLKRISESLIKGTFLKSNNV